MNMPSPARSPATARLPVVAVFLLAAACSRNNDGARKAPPPVPVKVAAAVKGDLPIYLDAIGNAKPLASAVIRPQVGGTLVKVHFTEGQLVKAGDLLAEIDPRPYEAALAQAKAQVTQVEGQAKQAQGQLAQSKGVLARDQAFLDNARKDLVRYHEAGASVVTRQQIDAATATVGQYEGAVAADLGAIAAGEGTIAAFEGAQAAAKSAVESAGLQLAYCRITSPIAGRIGLRTVDEGNLAVANDPAGLATVSQMQPMSVFFYIPENDLAALQKAVTAEAAPEVLAYDGAHRTLLAKGTLAAIDNQLDPATGTVKLRAVFDNQDLALFPNRSISVRLLAETRHGATLVPAEAVQIADEKRFLYVVKPDGKNAGASIVERREAKIGRTDETRAEVLEGIQPGERVVTDGIDRLRSGSAVIPDDGAKPKGGSRNDAKGGAKHGANGAKDAEAAR